MLCETKAKSVGLPPWSRSRSAAYPWSSRSCRTTRSSSIWRRSCSRSCPSRTLFSRVPRAQARYCTHSYNISHARDRQYTKTKSNTTSNWVSGTKIIMWTLCLLCTTLAWRRHMQKKSLGASRSAASSVKEGAQDVTIGHVNDVDSDENEWRTSILKASDGQRHIPA